MKKTMIGVFAAHDWDSMNTGLRDCFNELYNYEMTLKDDERILTKFHFLFTGGTFDRLWGEKNDGAYGLKDSVKDYLKPISTRLPSHKNGGTTILSNFISKRKCGIIWSFLTPLSAHWLNPENLALARLCDVWRTKRLLNAGSVISWYMNEAKMDCRRQKVEIPIKVPLKKKTENEFEVSAELFGPCKYHIIAPERKRIDDLIKQGRGKPKLKEETIALIAHNEMKPRMVEFAIDYQEILEKFERIITTGTTGSLIKEKTHLDNIQPCLSGPYGGDIEIATEIIYGRCKVVIFFIDPLNPHPHVDDIRVVFGACMWREKVQMLANEKHAREWMDRVAREWLE